MHCTSRGAGAALCRGPRAAEALGRRRTARARIDLHPKARRAARRRAQRRRRRQMRDPPRSIAAAAGEGRPPRRRGRGSKKGEREGRAQLRSSCLGPHPRSWPGPGAAPRRAWAACRPTAPAWRRLAAAARTHPLRAGRCDLGARPRGCCTHGADTAGRAGLRLPSAATGQPRGTSADCAARTSASDTSHQ